MSVAIQVPPFARDVEVIPNSADSKCTTVPNEPFVAASHAAVREFLNRELECKVLDELAPYFFVFCKRHSAHLDALHEYISTGIHVSVAEDPGLHLVRKYNVIFMKPIPHCLYNYDFWDTYLGSPDHNDKRHTTTCEDESIPNKNARKAISTAPTTNLSIACRSALGLLRSYGYLIKHESDFHIAQDKYLIPKHVTYTQFQYFIQPFRNLPDSVVSPRYQYGHIRMTRLNIAVRLCRPKTLNRIVPWSYHKLTYHSGQYIAMFVPPLLFLFACLTLLLSSMQVGLAAHPAEGEFQIFADVSLWFSVCVVVGIAVLGVFIVCGFAMYVVNRVVVGFVKNNRWKQRDHSLNGVRTGLV